MSNKLVKNNKVNGAATKGVEGYTSVVSRVINDLEREGISNVTLKTGEVMYFDLLSTGIASGVINMCGNMELAEERLDLIENEVAKHFGFADTEYKKLMIWTK